MYESDYVRQQSGLTFCGVRYALFEGSTVERVNRKFEPGEIRVNWTAVIGVVAIVTVSIGIWGAAIKAGMALLVR
jgi:hypothetical protein